MKRRVLIPVLVFMYLGLIPMVTWGQGNGTSTRSTLKIAIPVREFSEFVAIKRDPVTGVNNYSGFAIEVFDEIMKKNLPSLVPYEYVPFQKADGTMNGTFDDMLQAVFSKDYDGAVGEISILYYRTTWVDFTMPYIDETISMLVRVVKEQPTSKIAGFSLIGITYACLITAFVIGFIAFFVATGYACVIFPTCFRKHDNTPRDRALGSSIQTRLLIITLFLILLTPNACNIISQTQSNNTPQGRNGSFKNLSQLMKGSNVGYREGSFIFNLLRFKGFSESKLISLKSDGEMADMLFKGTSNGGVDAILANAPQLKLLQAKYCDNFTIVPIPNLHATGFGFAFGIGSNVVEDVSKGLLKLVDGGGLGRIQDRTIGNLEVCPVDSNNNPELASSAISRVYEWILIVGGLLIGLLIIVSLVFLF